MTDRTDIYRLADEELMHMVQKGDSDAFEVIYDRHGGAAHSLAYRMVGNAAVAEDVTQEAFMSVWRSSARFQRERGSVRSWVLGIVHHRTIDMLRRNSVHDRRRATSEGLEEHSDNAEATEAQVVRRDEARTVRAVLDELPDRQAQVIQLAYFGGFTHTEIADMLEMPIGTVKGRMRLGLEKMRAQLLAEQVA